MRKYFKKNQLISFFWVCSIFTLLSTTTVMRTTINADGIRRSAVNQVAYPHAVSILPSNDTYITEGRPDTEWDTEPSMWVGKNTDGGYGTQRSLLGFDLSFIPAGSVITNARLALSVGAFTTEDVSIDVSVRRADIDWQTLLTWNTVAPSLNTNREPVAVKSVPPVDSGQFTWDVTSIVNELGQEDTTFLSLLLMGNESVNNHERAFWSTDCDESTCAPSSGMRPRLMIEYDEPTSVPPTLMPTSTPVPTSTPTPTPSIDLSITADWQSAANSSTTAILPDIPFGIELVATNGSADLSNVVLTSAIPSGFELITDPIPNGGSIDNSQSPSVIIWNSGSLTANETMVRTYEIKLSPVDPLTLEFDSASPPDTAIIGTETAFALVSNSIPIGDVYCYLWNFGDGTEYRISQGALTYIYEFSGNYTVTVSIAGPDNYRARAETTITIEGPPKNPPDSISPPVSNCAYPEDEGVQNVFIPVEVTGESNDETYSDMVSGIVAPSAQLYIPLWVRDE